MERVKKLGLTTLPERIKTGDSAATLKIIRIIYF